MAKVKVLNFLLEFGQKNLHNIKPTTVRRYRGVLNILLDRPMTDEPLWPYQEGVKQAVDSIKKFVKSGVGYDKDFERTPEYRVTKIGHLQIFYEQDELFGIAQYEGTPQELGKMLVYDLFRFENLSLRREDFAYCQYCGNIYAKKSKKSRFCTQNCHVQFNKKAAMKPKPQEE